MQTRYIVLFIILHSSNIFAEKTFSGFRNLFKDQKAKPAHIEQNINSYIANLDSEFKFVSTHWREDKNELRIIYANSIALKTYMDGSKKFNEGSIFYKIVYKTKRDPSFKSSFVPITPPNFRQIMVKDSKKYPKTNGWGYIVWNSQNKQLPEFGEGNQQACHACHLLVKNKDYVFSDFDISSSIETKAAPMRNTTPPQANHQNDNFFTFRKVGIQTLDYRITQTIKLNNDSINLFSGNILQNSFPGTMTAIYGHLAEKTLENKLATFALKKLPEKTLFSFALLASPNNGSNCQKNQIELWTGSGGFKIDSNEINLSKSYRCINQTK